MSANRMIPGNWAKKGLSAALLGKNIRSRPPVQKGWASLGTNQLGERKLSPQQAKRRRGDNATVNYLASSAVDKGKTARAIAAEQKITEGLVGALTCVEPG